MKYNTILSLLLCVLFCLPACENFLDTESDSEFTEEVSFSNLDFAQSVLVSIYEKLSTTTLFGCDATYYSCDNDIEFTVGADNGNTYNLTHYNPNDGISLLNSWWTALYTSIERANLCIDNLPKSPIWNGAYANEARRLYGEAITMRAFYYGELIKLFGDVPFSTRSTQADDDFYLPKTDRDLIYEYLIEDLKKVEDYVPWLSKTGQPMRVNKAYTKGMRARMALTYAGYSLRNKTLETRRGRYSEEYYKIARDECWEIMQSGQHQLNPDYKNIFELLHSYSHDLNYGEVLFEVGMGRGKSGTLGYLIGMYFGWSKPSVKYGLGPGTIRTSPYYFYSFDTTDLRRNVSVELYTYGTSDNNQQDVQLPIGISGFRLSKWRKSWIVPPMGGDSKSVQFTGINWPIMRYSDILLMFAEAENHLNGPTDEAKQALISVRRRAFPESEHDKRVVAYVDSVSASKEMFFNAIVDERGWEFGGEMLRKSDLVRWNLLGDKIDQMQEECTKLINNDPEYQWVPNYLFWKTESDGETIHILNPHTRLPQNPIPDGYTRNKWISTTSDWSRSAFIGMMKYIAHGYDKTKNNHLYPINRNIIESSKGILTNDQIP